MTTESDKNRAAGTVIVGVVLLALVFGWLLASTELVLWSVERWHQKRVDKIHFVTTHNMIELRGDGGIGAGDSYRDAYGWICVQPKTMGAMFVRSDVIVSLGNPLLVCYWRTR